MTARTAADRLSLAAAGLAMALLTACAGVGPQQVVDQVNLDAAPFTGGHLALARSDAERAEHAQAAAALLAQPLGQQEAVQLALHNSPALQALLAQGWAQAADAAQAGRPTNPVFSLERMVSGDALDIGRSLSFGLLDLLAWPTRQGLARHRAAQAQLRLIAEVVDQVTQVRQAWVRAVAAGQRLAYAQQVYDSAEAGAELARRMQAVGNFSRLARAREHAFYADAGTGLVAASHQATAAREALVRALGLDEAQALTLVLPPRLPELPAQALQPQGVAALATRGRLDVRLAQAAWDAAAQAQGLGKVGSYTDIELTLRRQTAFDNAAGSRHTARGAEVGLRLPVFDWGGHQRAAWDARTLAAAHQLEATMRAAGSSLREAYSAYRTAHDIARHQRGEVLPLRKLISDEQLLRYNGMLVGVFELMADARDQVATVVATLEAEQQFWLADAALQAEVIGRPTAASLGAWAGPSSMAGTAGAAGH